MERIVEPEVMDTPEAAAAYDAMEHGEVDQAFVDRVIALGASTGHFLDVGTGPAQIPIILAKTCPNIQITAIDLSEEMLKIAEQHVIDAGLHDRITLQLVDAKDLPFPDKSFDGLISNSIVHHIHDSLRALIDMGRVVKPNGLVLIRDLIRPETISDAQGFVDKYAADDTPYQQKLYYDSFLAAFTISEVNEMLIQMNIPGATVEQSTDRHWSIEREFNSE
ncbi:methyltransferase domain-containing protein [Candidatus Poribacteria bacterium]|nr:methyltransferase domain-containing protein [Candidatus Poribacteria bacterium]